MTDVQGLATGLILIVFMFLGAFVWVWCKLSFWDALQLLGILAGGLVGVVLLILLAMFLAVTLF